MKLPQPIDYQQAVQRPDITFIDAALRAGRPRRTPLGFPWAATGGFALTFDITSDNERFAVRCFHRQGNHLRERYAHIAEFVGANPDLGFLVGVAYLAEGIRIEGNPLPIVRMPWVQGTPLNAWVEDHVHDHAALQQVRHQVSNAARWMRHRGAAHGDLQHGNILVGQKNAVHLVDYDGMFLPSLRDFGSPENGHRNYQHPDRDNHYDESLDLFAAHVIDLSLAALEHEPALWEEFNTEQNLLFSADDFAAPASSELFSRMRRIPELAGPTGLLMTACETDFGSVPNVLLDNERRTSQPRRPRSTSRRRANGPPTLLAHDRTALVEREGDEVTIVGRIADRRTATTRSGTPVTFLNFGNYRHGDFTLVAFGRASRELHAQFGPDLAELQDVWVSMTGFIQLYQSKWSKQPTPEIELQRVRSLRLLTAQEVEETLAATHGCPNSDVDSGQHAEADEHGNGSESGNDTLGSDVPAPPVHRTSPTPHSGPNPGSPQPGTAESQENLEQQVSKLYSSSRFARGPSEPSSTNLYPSPPRIRESRRPHQPGLGTSSSPPDMRAPRPPSFPTPSPAQPGTSASSASPRQAQPPKPKPGPAPASPQASPPPSPAASHSTPPPSPPVVPSPAAPPPKPRRTGWRERLRRWLRGY